MSDNTGLLRVAPPKGTQPATNSDFEATSTATGDAPTSLKALAGAVRERNRGATTAQQGGTTERNKHPIETTCLLRSVAMVPDGQPDPLRWPRFVALCATHDVPEGEARAMFTEQDIEDLCEEPDGKLPKHAATIVGAIRRDRQQLLTRSPGGSNTTHARKFVELVRCGRCQHFECNPQHPGTGLGACNARDDVPMGIPARLIECTRYQRRKQQ